MCGRSSPAQVANASSRRLLLHGRSTADCRARLCWHMCWCRSIADHLPLYRQSEIYAREGVDLDRSTLAGWVGAASELLAPLVDEIRKHVLAASKIHADDTPVPVLAPGNGKTKTGRLWTYVRDDRPAGYSHRSSRVVRLLGRPQGRTSATASEGLQRALCRPTRTPASIISTETAPSTKSHVGLMPRRKFHDIHVAHASPTTTEALPAIGALYGIEEEIRGKPAELRCSIRQARARPLLDDLRHWMEKTLRCFSQERDRRRDPLRALTLACSAHATSMMACWRSTTAPPSGRYALSPSDGRTISSWDLTRVVLTAHQAISL